MLKNLARSRSRWANRRPRETAAMKRSRARSQPATTSSPGCAPRWKYELLAPGSVGLRDRLQLGFEAGIDALSLVAVLRRGDDCRSVTLVCGRRRGGETSLLGCRAFALRHNR